MPNTVYGPYAQTSWTNGATALNQTHMNNLETQASVALNGFNGDLVNAFVLDGMICTKDGSVANQLDVTSGRAYLTMTDGTCGLIITQASSASQFLTSTPSTTYYLFLAPNGTWQFSTASSGPSNSLPICQATTDGSGNILVVTDKRTVNTLLLPSMVGRLSLPVVGGVGGQATAGSYGVPVIVAQALPTNVTTTTLQTLISYGNPAGVFRAHCTLEIGNTTASIKPALKITFTDKRGAADQVWGIGENASVPTTVTTIDGVSYSFPATFGAVAMAPTIFAANAGTITVTYQTGGTPNDYVGCILERLA